VTTERSTTDPVSQLANNIRGYAQMISAMSESSLAPVAGMAIEGVREWVTGALANAGGTIAGGAASLEALIPQEIRSIVRQEVESALSGLPGIPSKAIREELSAAQLKISRLEKELAAARASTSEQRKSSGSTSKSSIKKSPGKKPAKAPAQSQPVKKSAVKKSAVQKSAVQSSAVQSSAVQSSAVIKSAIKKSAAKRPAPVKRVAKVATKETSA
jgi:hypothetical protein